MEHEITSLLQCPVCLGPPRPGESGVGLCPNGHFVCYSCTVQVIASPHGCPSCREKPMTLYNMHHFVTTIIRLFTARIHYQCKYDGCDVIVPGDQLLDHERNCQYIPVPCHKQLCGFIGPVSTFLDQKHDSCLMAVEPCPTDETKWEFTLPVHDFYCVDRNTSECNYDFKLRLLSHPEKKSQAYFNYTNCNEDVIFYVGWIGKLQRYKIYTLSVYANNNIGSIGGHYRGEFKLFQEQVMNDRDGLYISHRTILQWIKWIDAVPDRTHVHVEIKFVQ